MHVAGKVHGHNRGTTLTVHAFRPMPSRIPEASLLIADQGPFSLLPSEAGVRMSGSPACSHQSHLQADHEDTASEPVRPCSGRQALSPAFSSLRVYQHGLLLQCVR